MPNRDAGPESEEERPALKTYECNDCGHRVRSEHQPGTCPNCGGEMSDISQPRE